MLIAGKLVNCVAPGGWTSGFGMITGFDGVPQATKIAIMGIKDKMKRGF
jgi:hypothetical protein